MVSSTNERTNLKREEQSRRDRVTDQLISKQLMESFEGRRWVWLRLSEAELFHEDRNFDPGYMAFRKGQREFALRLLSDVQKFSPTEYVVMVNEAQTIAANITKKDPNYVGTDHDDE